MKCPIPEIHVKKAKRAPRRKNKAKNALPVIGSMIAQTKIRAGQKLRIKSEWVNINTFHKTHKSPKHADKILQNKKVNKVPNNFFHAFRDCEFDERYCDDSIPADLHIGVRKMKNYMVVSTSPGKYADENFVLIKFLATMKHSCEPNLEFPKFQPGWKLGYWEVYAVCDIEAGTRLTLDLLPESYGKNRKANSKSFAQECHNPQCPLCNEECQEEC